jgi:hypothetical protein
MSLDPIEYRGELVALVGPDRFHLISPRLLACPPDDPELRFVAFMCVCRRRAAEAGLTDYVAGEVLERWARQALIDERDLWANAQIPSLELARRLHVPPDQVVAAREELAEGRGMAHLDMRASPGRVGSDSSGRV